MKIKKDGEEYEVVFKLPVSNGSVVITALNEWTRLVKEDKLKKKREIRLKKLNRINNLNKKN